MAHLRRFGDRLDRVVGIISVVLGNHNEHEANYNSNCRASKEVQMSRWELINAKETIANKEQANQSKA